MQACLIAVLILALILSESKYFDTFTALELREDCKQKIIAANKGNSDFENFNQDSNRGEHDKRISTFGGRNAYISPEW